MKPSNLSTPRQLADATFTVGHPEITRVERAGHGAVLLIGVVGLCVLCGLLIAGAL